MKGDVCELRVRQAYRQRIWDGYGARESTVELRFREVECLAEEHTATERESLD